MRHATITRGITACVALIGAIALAPDAALAQPETRPPGTTGAPAGPRVATGRVGSNFALRDNRVEAFPGRTLVVPIGPENEDGTASASTPPDWRPSDSPEVALVTDEPVPASIWRVHGAPRPVADESEYWLNPPFDWAAEPLAKSKADAPEGHVVMWFLVIEMPDRPVGRWLRVGNRKLPLEWVERAPGIAPKAAPQPDAKKGAGADLLDRLLEPERDPFRAWRIALGNLGRSRALGSDSGPGAILDAIDTQMRDRAFAAVARIRAVDAAMADRVVAMVTAIVETPDGWPLPAWPADPGSALECFAAVLREGRTDADVRSDVAAFLAGEPPALTWIIDEGGPDGPSGAPTCTIGVADRTGKDSVGSVAPAGMTAANATQVPAFGSVSLPVDPAYPGAITTTTLTARVGMWSGDLRVLAGWATATPPGISVGPLIPDWTHATWVRGIPPRINPSWVTVGMLQRQVDASGAPIGWEVIVESQWAHKGEGDAVTVWIGPMGQTTAAIRMAPDGVAEIIAGPLTGEKLPLAVNVTEGRWIAQLALPPELTGVSKIRVALERTDARGVRSAWPRPMMLGQPEPGRVAIDLTSW